METSGALASVLSRDNKRGIERALEDGGFLLSRIETVTTKGKEKDGNIETLIKDKDRKKERERE